MQKIYTPILFLFMLLLNLSTQAQTVKILFDATKAEMAGNADWVIDADVNNLGVSSSGKMQSGLGDEANPQGIPTPAQSGITASTPETFWKGALSAWAVDCAKKGYQVESLPYNDSITYGNANHAKDLTHYTVFIVCEPNILFTASEKKAIVQYVKDGGRLFIIADHDISDRNGDGYDSPTIWNDVFTTNSVQANPFGISFDLQDYSQTTTNVANLPMDSCLHGSFGNVSKMQISGGTTMTLNPSNNSTVKGLIFKTGASNTGNTDVFFARARYGFGKICALGDSSPPDDGTGDVNDILYNGYTGDANGQHQLLLMNATMWLVANSVSLSNTDTKWSDTYTIYPNPSHGSLHVEAKDADSPNQLDIYDIMGNRIWRTTFLHSTDLPHLPPGTLLLRITNKNKSFSTLVQVQ